MKVEAQPGSWALRLDDRPMAPPGDHGFAACLQQVATSEPNAAVSAGAPVFPLLIPDPTRQRSPDRNHRGRTLAERVLRLLGRWQLMTLSSQSEPDGADPVVAELRAALAETDTLDDPHLASIMRALELRSHVALARHIS